MPRARIHATDASRSAASRAARIAAGGHAIHVVLSPEAAQALSRRTAETWQSARMVIEGLLIGGDAND